MVVLVVKDRLDLMWTCTAVLHIGRTMMRVIWKFPEKIDCGPHSPQVSFTLNEELTVIEGLEDKTVSAPREHPFTMQSVGGQMLAVFTETSSGKLLYSSTKCHILTHLLQEKALKFACTEISELEPRGKWWRHSASCFLYSLLSSCTFTLLPALLCLISFEIVHNPNTIKKEKFSF